MRRTAWNLALVALVASATTSLSAQHQARVAFTSTPQDAPLLATNQTLLASLERIGRGSSLWREAIKSVRRTGRHAVVVTPADVTMTDAAGRPRMGLDPGVLAEAVPVFDDESRIPVVMVIVNLRLVQERHDARLSLRRDFEADLDRILVHEVYGHAVPYLLAGDVSGRCADPKPNESASDACSIRRENAVRDELGLGRRGDHGLSSLALTAGAWLERR
jgi:hypothetical protein